MSSRTENNFDFLRLFAASLVIVSHSYPLTGNREILNLITNEQMALGELAVDIFFVLSGYLIMISMRNSSSLGNFFWKRILRLFPALFVMLLFSLGIIAVVYTGNNLLKEKSFWTYFPNNLSLYRVQYEVNGVFENNPYPRAINGSLWSLCYEFSLYIFVGLCYFIRRSKFLLFFLVVSFAAVFFLANFHNTFLHNIFIKFFLDTTQLYRLSQFFIAGSILSFLNFNFLNKFWVITLMFTALILAVYLSVYRFVAPFILPIFILLFANSYSKPLNWFPKKFGDISYGIYIYGFVIQQLLLNYFSLNPWSLTLITLPIVMLLSWLSWHFVEKKFLKFKTLIPPFFSNKFSP